MPRKEKQTNETKQDRFPTMLRNLLVEKKITQKELAENIGVTRQAVSLYATGQSSPDINTFTKIIDYFGVSADYMLGKTDVPSFDIDYIAVNQRLGLSNESIRVLEIINSSHKILIEALDLFLGDDEFLRLLEESAYYFDYYKKCNGSGTLPDKPEEGAFPDGLDMYDKIKELEEKTSCRVLYDWQLPNYYINNMQRYFYEVACNIRDKIFNERELSLDDDLNLF